MSLSQTQSFADVETTITLDCLTPTMNWESRHSVFEQKEESMEIYRSFSEEEREIVKARVARAIELMHDQLDEWLPLGMSLDDTGTLLQIKFGVLISDIKADLERMILTTSFGVREAVSELRETLDDWPEEDSDEGS